MSHTDDVHMVRPKGHVKEVFTLRCVENLRYIRWSQDRKRWEIASCCGLAPLIFYVMVQNLKKPNDIKHKPEFLD